MSSLLTVLVALALPASSPADTVRLEVGSPLVDAGVYRPHRARVRVHRGGPDGPVTNEWMNELSLGDSAGRPVMRWTTTSLIGPQKGSVLRQTYDGVTMAPLAWESRQVSGAWMRLRMDGDRVVGERRSATDPTVHPVSMTLPRRGFIASASDLIPLTVGMEEGRIITAPVWGPNMATAEGRVFTVIGRVRLDVEGQEVEAWKVDEHREADGSRVATWYLTDTSPYMVAGEMVLSDGTVQWATEIALPLEGPP